MQNTAKDLIKTNSGDRSLIEGGIWLIYSHCLEDKIPESFKEKFDTLLKVCPESYHMNMIETKLASMISIRKPDTLAILTVDGSPHCIQLHYVGEDIRKYFRIDVKLKHYIYKEGINEVSEDAVKTSRYLSKIERLLHQRR
ncbi:MAG: hypothetical protein ACTSR0_06685 [Candidatus Asgardarchaeia archaeon]